MLIMECKVQNIIDKDIAMRVVIKLLKFSTKVLNKLKKCVSTVMPCASKSTRRPF